MIIQTTLIKCKTCNRAIDNTKIICNICKDKIIRSKMILTTFKKINEGNNGEKTK